MKKIILSLCFLALAKISSAHVTRIVEISRHDGLFGYYSDVEQKFLGYFSSGAEWWSLVCENPGFVRCRLRASAGKSSRDLEIEDVENAKLDDLMLNLENDQISQGHTTGEATNHYQTTLSDNSTIDIYITITWQPDPNDPGGTLFHAEISDNG